MRLEKKDYVFDIECFDSFAVVTIALPTILFTAIARNAGFDRDYERHAINEEIRNIFWDEMKNIEKRFFCNKDELCDYFAKK